ncbi:unnamed protein product [Meloidogyne enterolobii]|uniref:Uncharacterized protein n=1 Tax=Meloidogyne enterolobii TaxID=390850 RepID=A0ACB0XUU0_MELEN
MEDEKKEKRRMWKKENGITDQRSPFTPTVPFPLCSLPSTMFPTPYYVPFPLLCSLHPTIFPTLYYVPFTLLCSLPSTMFPTPYYVLSTLLRPLHPFLLFLSL